MKGVKGEIDQRPKRFYTRVDVAQDADAWTIALDGKNLRTPEKRPLAVPTQALANVIADEWRSQAERIDLLSMFNTRLANVALDRTPGLRAEIVAEAARYATTDLVCHLAERPAALREMQEAAWTPLRDWAGQVLGVSLIPVEGIVATDQPAESIEAVRHHGLSLHDFRLTALAHAVALFGSAVIGLAVERRHILAADAHDLSRVDEAFQISQWGEDAEAKRFTERARAEALALDRWFDALPL
jgi:chaperone required for assembly of F1-ATPase